MRILIVEDNETIALAIRRTLKPSFIVDIANSGQEGLLQAQTTNYDTILLDLNLPDIAGDEICRSLRSNGINTPIIVLSGEGEVKSKISLLNMGADDYITKPFNMQELRARIDVALRHTSNNSPTGKIVVDDLELDPVSRNVKRGDKVIPLRRKEFDLLEYLMRNKGQTLTRTMILEHVWDSNENLWANVIDVHIKHLRDKIDRPYGSKMIRTIHGIGYKFEAPVSADSKIKEKGGAKV